MGGCEGELNHIDGHIFRLQQNVSAKLLDEAALRPQDAVCVCVASMAGIHGPGNVYWSGLLS